MGDNTKKINNFIWLHYATRNNVLLFEQVLNEFADLEEAFLEAKKGNSSPFIKWDDVFKKRLFDSAEVLEKRLEWMDKNKVTPIIFTDEAYPLLLKEISHPPPVLYVKGKLPKKENINIAIVGMRNSTPYGEGTARHLGNELSKNGVTVVSGLALGIDSHASKGALDVKRADCPTIGVLGCGVDVIYPPSNANLYYEIIERGGIVSEFIEGTKPFKENFPMRNRVISGMSRGVVVVEAAQRSGSSITANYALEQNRDVFAVPGRITDETSLGPNKMIQRGEAKPVFCAADILSEYGFFVKEAKRVKKLDTEGLSIEEKFIVDILKDGERSADELCEMLSIPAAVVNSCLTSLQFSGIIKQLPGRVFGIC